MASRHQRTTSIGEYLPFHLNAFQATRTQLPVTPGNGLPVLDLGKGVYLGTVILNDPGSACVFTIFNGNNAANIVAVIKPTTNVTLNFECVLDQGLWYTYTGTTAGSITVTVIPAAV